ncbi:hypothetical protein Bca52824_096610 [Brassica carinata]|uniref:Cytochrome c oxidase assembly protein COX11, mitochondrial n=1 Tax=Brassica carinata TaxID=52824 RepID=A0A8X7NXV3_BRACI|nr:hypothetical protein Bca52824_096610 [Brassica carinata]
MLLSVVVPPSLGLSPASQERLFYSPIIDTKSKKMLYHLTAVVFGMVGLTYAAVPLYRTFCQATGYGGTVQHKEEIVVQFNADVADGMQWKFTPTQREVRVKP